MSTIKINGNDKELVNLSDDQISEQILNKDVPIPELKVDTSLLDIPESTPIKKIHNLS